MWLAVLEDEDGMWNSDPIGSDSREEVEKLAIAAWPKIKLSERRALYKCTNEGEIKNKGE